MLCPNCGAEMIIDDIDYRFKGNKDVYGLCKECKNSLLIYIRYGNVWKYEIHDLIEDSEYGLVENPKTETKTIYIYKKGENNG